MIKIKKYPKIDKSKYLGIRKPYCGGEPVILRWKSRYIDKEGFIDATTLCSSHFFKRNTRYWTEKTLDSFISFDNEKNLFKWLCDNYKNEDVEQDTIGFITPSREKGFCIREEFDCGHVYGYLAKNINDLSIEPCFVNTYNRSIYDLTININANHNARSFVFPSTIDLYKWLSED